MHFSLHVVCFSLKKNITPPHFSHSSGLLFFIVCEVALTKVNSKALPTKAIHSSEKNITKNKLHSENKYMII